MSHDRPRIPPTLAELAQLLGAPTPGRRDLGFGVTGGEWIIEPSFPGFSDPPPDVHYCLGKRSSCLRGDEGRMSCAEVEITRALRAAGWSGGWVNTYGGDPPLHWAAWTIEPHRLRGELEHKEFVEWLADPARGSGGTPDIIAVRGTQLLALECKRRSVGGSYGDSVRGTQERWVREAFERGLLDPDEFAVVWWTRRNAPLDPPSIPPEHEPTRKHPDRGPGVHDAPKALGGDIQEGAAAQRSPMPGQRPAREAPPRTSTSSKATTTSDLHPSEQQLREAQDGLATRGWKPSKSKSSPFMPIEIREDDGSVHACEHCAAGKQNPARWPLFFRNGTHAGQLLWTCTTCKRAQADNRCVAVVLVSTPPA